MHERRDLYSLYKRDNKHCLWTSCAFHLTIMSVWLKFQLIFKMFISFFIFPRGTILPSSRCSFIDDKRFPKSHSSVRTRRFLFSLLDSAVFERVIISVAKLPWNIRDLEFEMSDIFYDFLVKIGDIPFSLIFLPRP